MRDVVLLGLTRIQQNQIDAENASRMYSRPAKDGPTPFYYHCPLGAIEDVARGLRPETAVRFLLARHVVVVGGNEWALDGDLALWRKARAYARELSHQGLLEGSQEQDELVYRRKQKGGGNVKS